MTCVVGMITKDKILMGADSAGSNGHDVTVRANEKVFVKDNKMIFGFTGSFRMGQLLRYKLKIPNHPKGMDDYEYMVTKFIDEVRECFAEGGSRLKKDDVEWGSKFLVGYRQKIYHVEYDFQVGRRIEKFDAVGAGESVALGVLYMNKRFNQRKTSSRDVLKVSLEAAARFKEGVKPPFKICELKHRK